MNAERKVILILGKQGSGKSTLAKRIIQRWKRVIVFDPLAEYTGGEVVYSFDAFCDYALEHKDAASFTVICRFVGDTTSESDLSYEHAAKIVRELRNCLLVLEESELFIDSRTYDSAINWLISFGRHNGVSLIGIGRRPTELCVKLRSQFTTVVSFAQTEPNDLAYMEGLGFDAEELSELDLYEFITYGEPIDNEQQGTPQAARVQEQPFPTPMPVREQGDTDFSERTQRTEVLPLRDKMADI